MRAVALAREEFRRSVAKRRHARCVDVTDETLRGEAGGVMSAKRRGVMGPCCAGSDKRVRVLANIFEKCTETDLWVP